MITHRLEHSDEILLHVHPSSRCWGRYCSVHNMSGHALRHLPQTWSMGKMWRMCLHGFLHPDPDCIYHQGATSPYCACVAETPMKTSRKEVMTRVHRRRKWCHRCMRNHFGDGWAHDGGRAIEVAQDMPHYLVISGVRENNPDNRGQGRVRHLRRRCAVHEAQRLSDLNPNREFMVAQICTGFYREERTICHSVRVHYSESNV